jgi:hypothetical protein
MDLLKTMAANRQQQGLGQVKEEKKPVMSSDRPVAGTKSMRKYIISEKPAKKHVKEHLEAIIAMECESSSDEE